MEGVSPSIKKRIQSDVGDLIIESVLASVAGARSPVSGETFRALSRDYKAFKKAEGGSGIPDMELSGKMLNALTYKPTDSGLEVGFFGGQAWKADGHLKFSGKENNTPQRRFLPGEGQQFKADLQRRIDSMVKDGQLDTITRADLMGVTTKAQLYEALSSIGDNRQKIRESVLANGRIFSMIVDLGLAGLL